MACASASVHAAPPLVLNTQMGISDGQSGLVLQNAPLSQEPMVQAAQPAGIAPEPSPPLIVAPYVEVPSGSGPPNPVPRPPHRPSQPLPQPLPAPQ